MFICLFDFLQIQTFFEGRGVFIITKNNEPTKKKSKPDDHTYNFAMFGGFRDNE